MVLGDVIAVEAAAIVGFHDLEAVVVELLQRQPVGVAVVEDSKFHGGAPP